MATIDPEILKAIQQEAYKAAEQVYASKGTMFGVADIPTHTHNQIDSVGIPNLLPIPNSGNGVLSTSTLLGVIKGANSASQTLYSTNTGTPAVTNILTLPIPIIQGSGSTFPTITTGAPAAGATSATLTGSWGGTTECVTCQWLSSNGGSNEIRNVTFTSGSTAVTWAIPLTVDSGTTALTQIANSRFHGGSAPLGSVIGFINVGADNIRQLWIRADAEGDNVNGWFGIDFTQRAQ